MLQLPALHAFDTNSLGRADTGVNVLKLVEVLFWQYMKTIKIQVRW